MGVFVTVRMSVFLVVMMFMPVIIMVVMIMVMSMIVRMHVELYTFDARFLFPRAVQMKVMQVQFGEFAFELIERHTKIEQRANEHVAADAAENIQIQRFHFTSARFAARALIWLAA